MKMTKTLMMLAERTMASPSTAGLINSRLLLAYLPVDHFGQELTLIQE